MKVQIKIRNSNFPNHRRKIQTKKEEEEDHNGKGFD